jgi:hypothetical protein
MDEWYKQMSLEERCKAVLDTRKYILFYKEDGIWYADVEEHNKDENEMSASACYS